MKNDIGMIRVFFLTFTAAIATLLIQAPDTRASTAPVIVALCNRDTLPYHQLQTAFEENLIQKFPDTEISFYPLEKDAAKRAASLEELRKKRPNIVLALGKSSIRTAIKEFSNTPIVASMVMTNDTFAHTGNVTGVLLQVPPEIHFRWIKQFLPNKKQVGILYNPQKNMQWINEAEKYAERFDLNIIAIAVNSARDLPYALKELNRKAEVLIGIPDQTVYSSKTAKMVLLSSFRNKIPFIGFSKSWVKAGALYSLEWDYGDVGRQSASIASKILSGTSPNDIPVQGMIGNATYTVNIKTARHLKLDIKQELLDKAAYIFE